MLFDVVCLHDCRRLEERKRIFIDPERVWGRSPSPASFSDLEDDKERKQERRRSQEKHIKNNESRSSRKNQEKKEKRRRKKEKRKLKKIKKAKKSKHASESDSDAIASATPVATLPASHEFRHKSDTSPSCRPISGKEYANPTPVTDHEHEFGPALPDTARFTGKGYMQPLPAMISTSSSFLSTLYLILVATEARFFPVRGLPSPVTCRLVNVFLVVVKSDSRVIKLKTLNHSAM